MRRVARIALLLCAAIAAASAAWGQINLLDDPPKLTLKPKAESKVHVELKAAKTGLVAGETVDLAIAFTVEPGWHIYWRNPNGGQAPTVEWHLPAGYEV